MLARTGVLISDPSVQEMTYWDWCFMGQAFKKKETEEMQRTQDAVLDTFKVCTRVFRETLINLLGLNIGAGKKENDDDPMPYFPMILSCGRPEVVKELFDKHKLGNSAEVNGTTLSDGDADRLNEELMQLDSGDLEPLFTGSDSYDPFERWYAKDTQEMLRALGIEEKGPTDPGVE